MLRGIAAYVRRHHIALLALFFALGGTAFAAGSLINGSQIQPHTIAKNRLTTKAVKQLKGNKGARGIPGAAGPQGPAGPQGIQGVQGPVGPSAAYQNHVAANLAISTNSATPTTLNTLVLPGPGTYLVSATASLFDGAAAPSTCGAFVRVTRNGTQVGDHAEIGAYHPSAPLDHVETSLSTERLLAVSGASQTIAVTAYRFSGGGTCTFFNRTLTATLVGSGAGTLSATSKSAQAATGAASK